nr:CAHS 6a [Acutuncus antarcticus]
MESTRSGVTFTDDRALTIPAPVVAPQIHGMTQSMHLTGGASAEIHATTDVNLATESQLKDMGPEEYERYRMKVESLARQQELELSQKASTYRNQVEKDAELIRQTLERQHIRDIEFRKDMVEASVDRQQQEIQLEAEYAMRTLENERAAAQAALEQAKMSSHIDVNIDSAIGTTHSHGKVTTTSETRSEKTQGSPAAATRI